MSKSKSSIDYQRRLDNTRIFANALFNGGIVLMKNVNDTNRFGIYVPKNFLNNNNYSEGTVEQEYIIKKGETAAQPKEAC